MIGWLVRCFRQNNEPSKAPVDVPAEPQGDQRPAPARSANSPPEPARQDILFASTLDIHHSVEAEQAEDGAVNSLEEARHLILKLKARVRELEGSAGPNADTLLSLRLPEQEAIARFQSLAGKRGGELTPSDADRDAPTDPRQEKSVPHIFRAYTKQELVETLGRPGKPAAAVLLQAVCEEDLGNVAPELLLDVDPAVGDAVAAAPELVAVLKDGGVMPDFTRLASSDRLPHYLRMRLYMMQAIGARPILAYSSLAARALFQVRTDRQLQYVLEGQVQQDAMLFMLLQEMLDEMLSSPVTPSTSASAREADRSSIVVHSLSHFLNTANPKVFPFVPVTMRGCGYRKTSGEVVPCIIFEFSPDSNQGAFLEHLQRDYTMMGHINAIITLFTLKGDVLHQNAGSIAYYGYQRRGALKAADKRRGSGPGARCSKRPNAVLSGAFDGGSAAWLQDTTPPVLTQLFQHAPADALEGMLESMVQGGVWRSILPVPTTLATSGRPAPATPPATFVGRDQENIFSMEGVALDMMDRSIGNRPEVFEGSFAIGTPSGGRARQPLHLSRPGSGVGGAASGAAGFPVPGSMLGRGLTSRALNAVPEQSQEHERVSFAQQWQPLVGASEAGPEGQGQWPPQTAEQNLSGFQQPSTAPQLSADQQLLGFAQPSVDQRVSDHRLPPTARSAGPERQNYSTPGEESGVRVLRPSCTTIRDGHPKTVRVPRRSTTYSAIPSGGAARDVRPNSGSTFGVGAGGRSGPPSVTMCGAPGGVGGGSPRMSRIRRRSGLPLGLVDNTSRVDALSQSTWGLLGGAVFESRYDRPSNRDVPGESEQPGDPRVSAGPASQARAATIIRSNGLPHVAAVTTGATPLSDASGGAPSASARTTPKAGAATAGLGASAVPTADATVNGMPAVGSTVGGAGSTVSGALRSDMACGSLLSPSLCSQADQWQQWQFRHSQWQDALQSQPSRTSLFGREGGPGLLQSGPQQRQQPTGPWLLQQHQTAGYSQSSSSVATGQQSSITSNSRRCAGSVAVGALETGGLTHSGGGGGAQRQSSLESMARRHRIQYGDGGPSPSPSAGSIVSPQPSAHQHTDSNLMACNAFIGATSGTPALDPVQPRLMPPVHAYGQPSRFLPSPAGSPVPASALQGGSAGSAAAAAAAAAAAVASAIPQRSASSVLEQAAKAQPELQKFLTVSASVPSAAAGGAAAAGSVSAGGAGTAKPLHSAGPASSSTFRRAPMRQSERSNPNLVLPRAGSVNASAAVKSATSFSFGSRGPALHHRPLVRMMSFLNAMPSTSGGQAALTSGGGSGSATSAQHRVFTNRAGSGPSPNNMADPLQRMNSSRASVLGEGSIGAVGSSQSGVRIPANAFACGSLKRASMRHGGSGNVAAAAAMAVAMANQTVSETDDAASSLAALTTVATMGTCREAGGHDASSRGHRPGLSPDRDEGPRTYHEITATPFLDPVSKSQVVMVVQTDVTARVQLERRLAEVMEAEHKLLENIFPRHVLEFIAHDPAMNDDHASQVNLRMLSALPDLTKTATDHEMVTILFADIVGFTSMCKEVPAKRVMKFLNDLYTRFDTLLDIYGVYKVETIGDCYMVAGGLISKDADGFAAVRKDSRDNLQAWRVVSFAKAMLRDAQKVLLPTTQEPVKMRVGIHTGPVVSGVVGTRMPRFCLFGDTINTASRMESTCPYGRIQVSAATHALVPGEDWEPTGGVQVKGKGTMETYLLKQSPPMVLPTNFAAASMSTPGLPDLQLSTHGSSNLSRAAVRPNAGIGISIGSSIGSGANGNANGNANGVSSNGGINSLSHGMVVSAVTDKISAAASGPGGGVLAKSSHNGSGQRCKGSSSGKPTSFLFNTMW